MFKIEKLLEDAKVIKILDDIPDTQAVGKEMAAIYLNIHTKTLARLRQSENQGGLPYFQVVTDKTIKDDTAEDKATKEKTAARNQGVSYIMGDLRKFRASQMVANTMEAATLRGMTFSTLSDLFEELPFWIKTIHSEKRGGMGRGMVSISSEVIVGQLQTVSADEFKWLLMDTDAEIQQLSLDEAMSRSWANEEARQPFHDAYVEVLQNRIDSSNRQQEAAMLRRG